MKKTITILLILSLKMLAIASEVQINIFTGKYYKKTAYVPQMAIWVEKSNGEFIETLYVTESEGKGKYFGVRKRKEALPVWRNKKGNKISKSNLDGIAGASYQNNFEIIKQIDSYPQNFKLYLEVNKSFDYNSYFARGLSSKEKGYNTGYSGQPSIVYEVLLDKNNAKSLKRMKAIGHGSPTGKNGEINSDLSKLTTALYILDEIKVRIK